MTQLTWDGVGQREYETGVDKGVLYIPSSGVYSLGVAWNGLTTVTESPSGAEANPFYADNIKYLNLISAEDFACTIEAYTYPDEFEAFNGSVEIAPGVRATQQDRGVFGFAYRTLKGNDVSGTAFGYKLHLVYGAQAAPSEKANATVNDSPEPLAMSWEVSTTPVSVAGHKPTAHLVIDSTDTDSSDMSALELILYGSAGTNPRLPLPGEVASIFASGSTGVTPGNPSFDDGTDTITIPATTGVVYQIDGAPVSGSVVITGTTVVTAVPASGYYFQGTFVTSWLFTV